MSAEEGLTLPGSEGQGGEKTSVRGDDRAVAPRRRSQGKGVCGERRRALHTENTIYAKGRGQKAEQHMLENWARRQIPALPLPLCNLSKSLRGPGPQFP